MRKLIFPLCLLLSACSKGNQWKVDEISTGDSAFSSARLRYVNPQDHSPLTFEIFKAGDEIEAFISSIRARIKAEGKTHCAKVVFTIGSESVEESIPLHEGGMRLRVPKEITDKLVQALKNGDRVNIALGGFEQTLKPEQFASTFDQFVQGNSFFQNIFKGPAE